MGLPVYEIIILSRSKARYRNFVFTLNNPDEMKGGVDGPMIIAELSERPEVSYLVYQKEVGDKGTPHYQGYCELSKQVTCKRVNDEFLHKRAHTERRRGNQQQAIHYCMKPVLGCGCGYCVKARTLENNGVLEKYVEYGERNKQGLRADLRAYEAAYEAGMSKYGLLCDFPVITARYPRFQAQCLAAICDARRRKMEREGVKPKLIVYWGDTGTGKSKSIRDEHGLDNVFAPRLGMGTHGSIWFDGYQLEDVLVLDDFYGQIKLHDMLTLTDWWKCHVQIKGGMIMLPCKYIYITSNVSPENWYRGVKAKAPSKWDAFMRRIDVIKEFKAPEVQPPRPRPIKRKDTSMPGFQMRASPFSDKWAHRVVRDAPDFVGTPNRGMNTYGPENGCVPVKEDVVVHEGIPENPFTLRRERVAPVEYCYHTFCLKARRAES